MKLEPQNDLLIIKEPPRETQTKSGIVLPEVANARDEEQVAQGEVLSSDNAQYQKGDMILFHKVLPIDAMMEDDKGKHYKVWFLKADDVLAKIN